MNVLACAMADRSTLRIDSIRFVPNSNKCSSMQLSNDPLCILLLMLRFRLIQVAEISGCDNLWPNSSSHIC